MSQNTNINESIIIARRHEGSKPPTRFINLDRMPSDEDQIAELHDSINSVEAGVLGSGWGDVSEWPAERVRSGDWTAAIWRSRELAQSVSDFAPLRGLEGIDANSIYQAGRRVSEFCTESSEAEDGSFPVLHSKGADGQTTIEGRPDSHYKPKDAKDARCQRGVSNLLARASHLLITDGQDSSTARLTAVASKTKYVGVGWMPLAGYSPVEAKALSVFLNSTMGRNQLMRNAARKLSFPMYRPAAWANVRIPDVRDDRIRRILADC